MRNPDIIRPEEEPVVIPQGSTSYGVRTAAEDKAHLRMYWRSVRKHLWQVVGIAVFVPMVTAVFMVRKPDIYEAQSLVEIDREDVNPAGVGPNNKSVLISSTVNDPSYFSTQLQILTSAGLLRRVIKTLDLEHNKAFLHHQSVPSGSTWQSLLRTIGLGRRDVANNQPSDMIPLANPTPLDDSQEDRAEAERLAPYVENIRDQLEVEPLIEKKMGYGRDITRLIHIRYSHPNPQIAAQIVNTIAEVLAVSNLKKKAETNISTGDFLQKRVAELQGQIRSGEERLIDYAESKQILSLDATQNTVIDRLVGLNRQLLEAENERKLAETAYHAALAPGAASALAEDKMAEHIANAQARLAELRQRRAQLLIKNTAEWPEVKEADQQIAVIEKGIADSLARSTSVTLTNLGTHYRKVLARERELRTAFDRQRSETLTQNEAAINYRIIQQEIETNKSLLEGLLQRYKENDVVLAGLQKNIHVIDFATAPKKPVGPKRLQTVALAFVLSLILGICWSLFLEYLDNTMRSIEDVETTLHLPALVAVPSTGGSRDKRGQTKLLTETEDHAPAAESYRQLRTSILLSTPGGAPKTLLVTSSLPGEGKTTTAANLALSLAQFGAKVLIVDADMRRPRLHSIFGLVNNRGLSTYLSSEMGEDELSAMLSRCVSSNLHVLTSGPVPPNPAELLGSQRMGLIISAFESTFKYIIIDSPPVTSFTDGVLLGSMADCVLLVVHSGKTQRDLARRSRQLLLGAGAKILGVVLNQVDVRSHDYYYQGYYQQPNGNAGAGSDGLLLDPDTPPLTAEAPTASSSVGGSVRAAAPAPNGTTPHTANANGAQPPKKGYYEQPNGNAGGGSDGLSLDPDTTAVIAEAATGSSSVGGTVRPAAAPNGIPHTANANGAQPPNKGSYQQPNGNGDGRSDGLSLDPDTTVPTPDSPAPDVTSHVAESTIATPAAMMDDTVPQEEVALPADGREIPVPAVLSRTVFCPPVQKQITGSEASGRAPDLVSPSHPMGDAKFQEICAAFDDPNEAVCAAAARALYNFSADRVAPFARALREATTARRHRIGAAIASSGLAGEAIRDLCLESREGAHDAFSLLFLMAMAGKVEPLIDAVAGHPNFEVRVAILRLLALSGREEVFPRLLHVAKNVELPPEVYKAIMEAIEGWLKGPITTTTL